MPRETWTGRYYIEHCSCGSGQRGYEVKDARGIFLTFACSKCREEKLSHYRPDVLDDPNYWHDEPIDSD